MISNSTGPPDYLALLVKKKQSFLISNKDLELLIQVAKRTGEFEKKLGFLRLVQTGLSCNESFFFQISQHIEIFSLNSSLRALSLSLLLTYYLSIQSLSTILPHGFPLPLFKKKKGWVSEQVMEAGNEEVSCFFHFILEILRYSTVAFSISK